MLSHFQTIFEQLKEEKTGTERVDHFYDLSRLLIIAFDLLRCKQSLHFTALSTINKIIDICIVHRNYEITTFTKNTEQTSTSDLFKSSSPKRKTSQFYSEENAALNRHFSLSRKERRASHDGHSKSDAHERHVEEKEDSKGSSISNCTQIHRTPLDVLTSWDPSQILSVLHNNITMHKRIIGTRQKCTPSTRSRHCTHHCLQILSARILTVMCHGANVQHKLVHEGHAKTLVEALDPNHDPVSTVLQTIPLQIYFKLIKNDFKQHLLAVDHERTWRIAILDLKKKYKINTSSFNKTVDSYLVTLKKMLLYDRDKYVGAIFTSHFLEYSYSPMNF